MIAEELITAKNEVLQKGFLDIEPDPALDLFGEIERLKKEKNAVVLAHYYQSRISRMWRIISAIVSAWRNRRKKQRRT